MDFQKFKENSIKNFTEIIESLSNLIKIVEDFERKNVTPNEFLMNNSSNKLQSSMDKSTKILEILKRNRMKLVCLGKTSNGKSTVINALLGMDVLPSSVGRTTSCFISITGTTEEEGYFLVKNQQKKDKKLINEYAHELHNPKLEFNSILKMFWPKSECELLQNDLELVDSPGIDVSEDNDKWIKEYCEDADIFLLVVNGCKTIHETEKSVFIKVVKQISKPNMFVLFNKWDLVKEDSVEIREKLFNQHLKEASDYLVDCLKIYSNENVRDRIYFVSALNALKRNETEDFEKFKAELLKDLNINSTTTKFKHHLERGVEIIKEIKHFCSEYLPLIQKIKDFSKDNILTACSNTQFTIFNEIDTKSKQTIALSSSKLAISIKTVIDNGSDLEGSFKILEEHLVYYLNEILEKKFTTLNDELKKIFQKYSSFLITEEKISSFFNEHLRFDAIINQYKRDVELKFINTSSEIKKTFKNKHNKSEIYSNLRKFLKIVPEILMPSSTVVAKVNANAAMGMNIAAVLFIAADKIVPANLENLSSEENIGKELQCYFCQIFDAVLSKVYGAVSNLIKESVQKCDEEQRNLSDLVIKFENIRSKFDDQIIKLSDEINKLLQI